MDYQQGEKIHLADYIGAFWRNDLDFSVINIIDDDVDGNDIVVSFWLKRGGGTGGTIILKGVAGDITLVEDDFIINLP